jgi:hypothetical protein
MANDHEAPEPPVDPIPVGTVLAAGDPAPETTPAKAWAAIWWALVPALLAALLTILTSINDFWPGRPEWMGPIIAIALIVLTPIAASYGVYRTPNLLKTSIKILGPGGE